MIRIVLFLLLIAAAAWGAAWIADQPGDVVLQLARLSYRDHAADVRARARHPRRRRDPGVVDPHVLLRAPGRIQRGRHARRQARGRHAITQGLLAIGHGDATPPAPMPKSRGAHAGEDPLALLLHAQTGAARRRSRRRAPRLLRHGGARGHAAARPARPVHRGAARRRCGRRRDDRGGSAEDWRRPRPGRRRRCWDSAAPRATGAARSRSSTTISPPA